MTGGDLAKISLKLVESQIAINLWKYHLQISKIPSKITYTSVLLENMICKSKSITREEDGRPYGLEGDGEGKDQQGGREEEAEMLVRFH